MTLTPAPDFYTSIPDDVLSNVFQTPLKYASHKVKILNDLTGQVTTVSTDGALTADSDTVIPTQKAVKDYVDNHSGAVNTYSQPLVDTAGVVAIRDNGSSIINAVKQSVTNASDTIPTSAAVYAFLNALLPLTVTAKRIPYGNSTGTGYTSGGLTYDNTTIATSGILNIAGGVSLMSLESREDTAMSTIQASTSSMRFINGGGISATFNATHDLSVVGGISASNYTSDQAAAVTNASAPTALNPFVTVSALSSSGYAAFKRQTGIISGGTLSINTDLQKFDVAAGTGWFIDTTTSPGSATMVQRTWAGFSAITVTARTSNARTWVYLDMLGGTTSVGQQTTYPTAAERRNRAYIGNVWHVTNANLQELQYLPTFSWEDPLATDIIFQEEFPKKLSVTDLKVTANGANMLINTSGGTAVRKGINASVSIAAPNSLTVFAATNVQTKKVYRNGSGGLKGTVASNGLFPSQYDNGSGTLQNIPAGNFSIQLIVGYYCSTGSFVSTFYGQNYYATMELARVALATYPYDLTNDGKGGIILAAVIMRQDATSLIDTAKCMIVPYDQFSAQAIISEFIARTGENDVMVTASAIPGGATMQSFNTDYRAWRFASAGDDLYFSGEFEHGWQIGTTWTPHIHISTETTAVAPNDQYQWTLNFTYFYSGAPSWTSSTTIATGTYSLAAPLVHNINFPVITPAAGVANPILFHLHVTRNAPANAYTGNVFLHGCGVHYISDRWGKN